MDTFAADPDILDLADILPPASRQKLERLVEARDDAHTVLSAANERARAASNDLSRLEIEVARKVAELRYSPLGGESYEGMVARLEKPLAPKRAEVGRLRDAARRAEAGWQAFDFLAEVHFWLGDARSRRARFAHSPLPTVKTKNPVDAVEKLRAELDELDAAWAAAEAAPAPANDLRERMAAAVEKIARQGQPDFNPRVRDGDPMRLAHHFTLSTHGSGAVIGTGGAPLLVWLFQDEIKDRLSALIAAAPQTGVLTDAERVRRFEEIAARRLVVEREEEAIIAAAEGAGQRIARRRDADPRAILELQET